MKRPKFKLPRLGSGDAADADPEAEPKPEPWTPLAADPARRPSPPREETESTEPEADEQPAKIKRDTTGLWFRGSTRVRAGGYWAREKGQAAAKSARGYGERAAEFWHSRSKRGRIQIAAVAGILLLYALLKFVPVPGVPCGFSAAKVCAPGDETIAVVPANSLLYAHVTLDGDTAQSERAAEAFEQLAELERVVVGGVSTAVPAPSGAAVDVREDVLSWAEEDLAVAIVRGAGKKAPSEEAFLAGVGDRSGAEEFIAKIAPAGAAPTPSKQGDATLDVYAGGFATAFVEGQLAFGAEPAVRAILDVAAGTRPALKDSTQGAARDDLSEARFAEVYVSRAGIRALLAGRVGPAAQLETFVDYGASSGLAAGVIAEDDGLEIELVSRLDPKLAKKSPSFFSGLPAFEPDLADEAGERAIGYVGVGEVGPTVAELLERAGPEAEGLAGSLRALATQLETEAGVNPLRDLLPTLGGQAALVAEPTDGRPFASLIVEDVDEDEAAQALARLQGPLLRATRSGADGGQVPRFEETDVDGVTVRSVQLSPVVNLAYALFDGKLVISTSPDGIEQVRSDSEGLADSDVYRTGTEQLPNEVSALVFLNLDELFGQVEGIGLAEDPTFADLTVLFENASSAGLAVNGEDDRIRTELFLAVD